MGFCGVGEVFGWPGSEKWAQVGGRMAQKLEAQKTTPVGMMRRKKMGSDRDFFGGKRWMHHQDGTAKMAEGWAALWMVSEQAATGLQSRGP